MIKKAHIYTKYKNMVGHRDINNIQNIRCVRDTGSCQNTFWSKPCFLIQAHLETSLNFQTQMLDVCLFPTSQTSTIPFIFFSKSVRHKWKRYEDILFCLFRHVPEAQTVKYGIGNTKIMSSILMYELIKQIPWIQCKLDKSIW